MLTLRTCDRFSRHSVIGELRLGLDGASVPLGAAQWGELKTTAKVGVFRPPEQEWARRGWEQNAKMVKQGSETFSAHKTLLGLLIRGCSRFVVQNLVGVPGTHSKGCSLLSKDTSTTRSSIMMRVATASKLWQSCPHLNPVMVLMLLSSCALQRRAEEGGTEPLCSQSMQTWSKPIQHGVKAGQGWCASPQCPVKSLPLKSLRGTCDSDLSISWSTALRCVQPFDTGP